jgi:hypothetical protein
LGDVVLFTLAMMLSIEARLVAAEARFPPDSRAKAEVFRLVPALAVTEPVIDGRVTTSTCISVPLTAPARVAREALPVA